MVDFNKMYATLFNAVTDAINILQKAQAETEELYISQEDKPNLVLLKRPDDYPAPKE